MSPKALTVGERRRHRKFKISAGFFAPITVVFVLFGEYFLPGVKTQDFPLNSISWVGYCAFLAVALLLVVNVVWVIVTGVYDFIVQELDNTFPND